MTLIFLLKKKKKLFKYFIFCAFCEFIIAYRISNFFLIKSIYLNKLYIYNFFLISKFLILDPLKDFSFFSFFFLSFFYSKYSIRWGLACGCFIFKNFFVWHLTFFFSSDLNFVKENSKKKNVRENKEWSLYDWCHTLTWNVVTFQIYHKSSKCLNLKW